MKTLKQHLQDQTCIPMHMPGHKRNEQFSFLAGYTMDFTEIEGCDDLYHPTGILKEAMARAAALYQAAHSFYLVNGSTCGILAALHAVCPRGSKILLARNCHKSVYHAAELLGLQKIFLYPKTDENGIFKSLEPEQVQEALSKHPDAVLLLLTSPTYEGICSDIQNICTIAHSYNIPVMVDAAHGAHLGFHPYFPKNPVALGADIAVESLHKTLPCLTQTALLHVNSSYINEAAVLNSLSLFQTSSPSYVLMAAIDSCLSLLASQGPALFTAWSEMLKEFYQTIRLNHLKIFTAPGRDPSKIVILCGQAGLSGMKCAEILRRKYHIETEMAAPGYVIALSGLGEKKENLLALKAALEEMDATCRPCHFAAPPWPKEIFSVPPKKAETTVSTGYLWAYPPGIPLLMPGQHITPAVQKLLAFYRQYNIPLFTPTGTLNAPLESIENLNTD